MHKASLSIYKALKQFYVIFLIKLVLNFNQFITLMTLSTHTGEKKIQYFTSIWIKKKDCIRSCKMHSMVQQCYTKKNQKRFQTAWKHRILELYSVSSHTNININI